MQCSVRHYEDPMGKKLYTTLMNSGLRLENMYVEGGKT